MRLNLKLYLREHLLSAGITGITIWLILILFLSLYAFPADETIKKEPTDDTSGKLLKILLSIPESANTITREEFINPSTQEAKEKISRLLDEAAELEKDQNHKKYLRSLSKGVVKNRFFCPIKEWLELKNNMAEILFVPTMQSEEDKKMFNTLIYTNDREETEKVKEITKQFNRMVEKLPSRSSEPVFYLIQPPQIKVTRLAYTSFPAEIGTVYPTLAMANRFRFPDYSFQVLLFKNISDEYCNQILDPIAKRILSSEGMENGTPAVTPESFFYNLILHRVSHHMGQMFMMSFNDKKNYEKELKLLSEWMGDGFPTYEELKARILTAYNLNTLKDQKVITEEKQKELLTVFTITLIDRIRITGFKLNPSSRAALVIFNFLVKKGALNYNVNTKKLSLVFPGMIDAIKELATLTLAHNTPYYDMFKDNVIMLPEITEIMGQIKDIPINITKNKGIINNTGIK